MQLATSSDLVYTKDEAERDLKWRKEAVEKTKQATPGQVRATGAAAQTEPDLYALTPDALAWYRQLRNGEKTLGGTTQAEPFEIELEAAERGLEFIANVLHDDSGDGAKTLSDTTRGTLNDAEEQRLVNWRAGLALQKEVDEKKKREEAKKQAAELEKGMGRAVAGAMASRVGAMFGGGSKKGGDEGMSQAAGQAPAPDDAEAFHANSYNDTEAPTCYMVKPVSEVDGYRHVKHLNPVLSGLVRVKKILAILLQRLRGIEDGLLTSFLVPGFKLATKFLKVGSPATPANINGRAVQPAVKPEVITAMWTALHFAKATSNQERGNLTPVFAPSSVALTLAFLGGSFRGNVFKASHQAQLPAPTVNQDDLSVASLLASPKTAAKTTYHVSRVETFSFLSLLVSSSFRVNDSISRHENLTNFVSLVSNLCDKDLFNTNSGDATSVLKNLSSFKNRLSVGISGNDLGESSSLLDPRERSVLAEITAMDASRKELCQGLDKSQVKHLLKKTLKQDMFRKRQLKNRETIRAKQRMVMRFLGSNAFVNGPTQGGTDAHGQVSNNPEDVEARLWEMIKVRDTMRRLEKRQGYRKPAACRTPYSFESIDSKTGKVVLGEADKAWFSDNYAILDNSKTYNGQVATIMPSALDAGDQGLSKSIAHCGTLEEVGGFANPQGLAHFEDIRVFHDVATDASGDAHMGVATAYEVDFYGNDSPIRTRSGKEAVIAGETKIYSLSGGSRQTQSYLDEFYANKYLDTEEWNQWFDQVSVNDGFVDLKQISAAAMSWNGGMPDAGEVADAAKTDFFGCLMCGVGVAADKEKFPCYECQTNCATCRGVKHAPSLHSLEKGIAMLNEMSIQKKLLWMPVLLEMQDELEMQVRKAREDYKLKEEADAMALPTVSTSGSASKKVTSVGSSGIGSQVRILVSSEPKATEEERKQMKDRYEKGAKMYLRNRALATGPPRGKLVLSKLLASEGVRMGLKFDTDNNNQAVLFPLEEDATNLVPGLLGAELERLSHVAESRGVEIKLLEGPAKADGERADSAAAHAPTTRGQRDLVRLASSSIRSVVAKAAKQMKTAKPDTSKQNDLSFLDQNFTDFGDIILEQRFIHAFRKLVDLQNGEKIAERIIVPVSIAHLLATEGGASGVDRSIYSAFLYKTVRIPVFTSMILGGTKVLRENLKQGETKVDGLLFPRSWQQLEVAEQATLGFAPYPDTDCANFLFSSAQKTPVFDIFNTLRIMRMHNSGDLASPNVQKTQAYAGRLADPEVWTSVFRDFINTLNTNEETKFDTAELVDRAEKLGYMDGLGRNRGILKSCYYEGSTRGTVYIIFKKVLRKECNFPPISCLEITEIDFHTSGPLDSRLNTHNPTRAVYN